MLKIKSNKLYTLIKLIFILALTTQKDAKAQDLQCIVKDVMENSRKCCHKQKDNIIGFKFYIDTIGNLRRMDIILSEHKKIRQIKKEYLFKKFSNYNYSDNLPKVFNRIDLILEKDSTYTYPIMIKYIPNQSWDCN